MPATTAAPGAVRDLLLVCAIGMLGGGLATVAAGVVDASPTFVAVPLALATQSQDESLGAAYPCHCDRSFVRGAVGPADLQRYGSAEHREDLIAESRSPRDTFLGETALMRERARGGRLNDPRMFLEKTARATRMRGVGLFRPDDMPPTPTDE